MSHRRHQGWVAIAVHVAVGLAVELTLHWLDPGLSIRLVAHVIAVLATHRRT